MDANKSDREMEELFKQAQAAAFNAYAPYSGFSVGAALLGQDGVVYTGCNVENRSYGNTICAERGAVMKAVSSGITAFKAIALSTPDSIAPVAPCGACRQVLSEFMPPESPVFFGGSGQERVLTSIGELYPFDSLHELKG